MPQAPDAFHTHLTTLETAVLHLLLRQPRAWKSSLGMLEGWLKFMKLNDRAHVPVDSLSGGQVRAHCCGRQLTESNVMNVLLSGEAAPNRDPIAGSAPGNVS